MPLKTPASDTPTPARFKVASYNIRKCIGTDRLRRPERVIEVLSEIDADVIALQEADRRFGTRLAAIPHVMLDAHSDYASAPLALHSGGMGWHGNALLFRKSAEMLACNLLHLPYLEPRGAVTADLSFGTGAVTGPVRVVGMHLDLSGLWRRRQAAAICHAVDQAAERMPVILMGDLNEWSAGSGCLRDFGRHFSFAPCGRSYHSRRPVARLDRIMHNGALKLIDSGVHDSAAARRASDHLPVWAEFELA